MTKGEMRCIGTPAHLKYRFGRGYRVELKIEGGASLDESVEAGAKAGAGSSGLVEQAGRFIEQELGGTVLEAFGQRVTGSVPPRDDQSPAAIFRLLEERCDALSISDYSVSQPTMEQVRAATLFATSHKPKENCCARSSLALRWRRTRTGRKMGTALVNDQPESCTLSFGQNC